MSNFFTDNEDIQFLFKHMNLARCAALCEEDFQYAKEFDFAPADANEAADNYRRILETVGEISGERVAPTAADTDMDEPLTAPNTVHTAILVCNKPPRKRPNKGDMAL